MTPLALYHIKWATLYLDQVTDDKYDGTDDVDKLNYKVKSLKLGHVSPSMMM